MPRIVQPPVDPSARDPERQAFWPAAVLIGFGLLLAVGGTGRSTGVPTTDGGVASEVQLMGAFAHGGMEPVLPEPPPDPATLTDPTAFALAMERWQRQREQVSGPGFRVNPGASDPCPT